MIMTMDTRHSLVSRFSLFLTQHMGLYFPPRRWGDLLRGMETAAQAFGCADAEACMQWLLAEPLNRKRIEILAGHLTVGETYFFREPHVFEALETCILPALIQSRRASEKRLRIWSAGCSTGEEAYSLAILLQRMIPDYKQWNITILGTDINPHALRTASLGIYSNWSFRNAPPWLVAGYFSEAEKGQYRIRPEVRTMVTFSYLNLAEDAYPSLANNTNALDIIFCRNVLLYFAPELAAKVVRQHCRALLDGGWLVVSPTEISPASFAELESVNFPGAILLRKKTACTKRYNVGEVPVVPEFLDEAKVLAAMKPLSIERKTQPIAARKIPSLQPASLYEQALVLFRQGRYAEAEEQITRLLAEQQNHVPAVNLMARIHANQGQLAVARQWCERALAADRLNPAGHYVLATVLLELGELEGAEQALKRTLYLDQDFVLAHFTLGNLCRRQVRHKAAEKCFANALSLASAYARDDVLPESDGMTAGRLIEIIRSMNKQEKTA